jgi:hypothetical protein
VVIRVRGIEIDPKRRAITHAGNEVLILPHGYTRWATLVSLICGGGLTVEELFDHCYGHRPDGGPDRGPDHMRMYLGNEMMKAYYRRLGLRLYVTRSGERINRYELIPAFMERGCR